MAGIPAFMLDNGFKKSFEKLGISWLVKILMEGFGSARTKPFPFLLNNHGFGQETRRVLFKSIKRKYKYMTQIFHGKVHWQDVKISSQIWRHMFVPFHLGHE